MSGELFNEHWKHSNGAWIRTEIWAALYPGNVEQAIRYAFEDASVDHGFAEGSYAAIFVALAFVTMMMVRHGDAKVEAKKGLDAFDSDD